MKLKLHKNHKEDKDRKVEGGTEEEKLLQPQKKLLSFTRSKDRKPRQAEVKQSTGPDLEDFRDLMDDEDNDALTENNDLLGTGFPRRSKSHLHRRSLSATSSVQGSNTERPRSSRHSESGEPQPKAKPIEPDVEGSADLKGSKPLPRLLAPRTSIAETVAANRAASETLTRTQLPATIGTKSETEAATGGSSTETSLTPVKEGAIASKKKSHSTVGHLWKVVKNDLLNPKAAAADLQAISLSAASMSVSAAKQAGSAMNNMATKVESDISNLHDQILGGKRNLPDHSPSGKAGRGKKASSNALQKATPQQTIEISVMTTNAPNTPAQDPAMPNKIVCDPPCAQPDNVPASNPAEDAATKSKTLKPSSQAKNSQPATQTGNLASDGLTVQKSKGSAYMLSKYEDEPESPNSLTEALTKTAEVLSQGTEAMLSGANGSARYLKRMLMCGIGGRHKA